MKIHHDSEIDYLSIDFSDEIEAKSEYKDGIIVRYNKKGNIVGIDITDSMKLFASSSLMTLQEACEFLNISESTMRRKIKANKVKFSKEGKDYRFKKSDIIKLAA
ncbi:MAG: helix-turn-helix domain-containing protein [Halobacteriovoraceae bacterium]|jgi:excisionase family DNA binding protein|nr:helix-turn-helix domain-containing protein [Halobacteriovoraceae bacterium]